PLTPARVPPPPPEPPAKEKEVPPPPGPIEDVIVDLISENPTARLERQGETDGEEPVESPGEETDDTSAESPSIEISIEPASGE
ncbi:MAG: hypothetical protein D6795_01770, partial [Deltaproteobacteria bacterium]